MKKFIFTLLLVIFMIPNVNAECINLVDDNVWYFVSYSGPSYFAHYSKTGKAYTTFSLDINKIYTVYFEDLEPICESCTLYFFGNNTNIKNENYITVTPKQENGRLYFNTNNSDIADNILKRKLIIVEGDSVCNNEPDTPDEPVIADATLDTFYSIYLDKIKSLSKYAMENKFILGAIGIVILVIVLELFLYLFRKGGYR